MLQSGLHRKPFIGSNVDGIAELIKEGVNGLLFTSGNAPELAKKIKYIKNNKTIVRKFSQNLHKEVINNYTEKTIIPQITKLYKQASKS
jgi:glycosyltransferase involved in cell wall biosynthesis